MNAPRAIWNMRSCSRSRSRRRGLAGGQTFFNQISPDLPVLEGRKHEPVRLFTVQRFIAVEGSLPRIFRGTSHFASRFCSSPLSARRSCSSRHHFSVLSPLVVIRSTIRERPSQNRSASLLFQQRRGCESFATGQGYKFLRTLIDVSAHQA